MCEDVAQRLSEWTTSMVGCYHCFSNEKCLAGERGWANTKRKERPHDIRLSSVAEQLGLTHRARLPVHYCVLGRPSSRVPTPHYLQ
jgi:hypothetical protein